MLPRPVLTTSTPRAPIPRACGGGRIREASGSNAPDALITSARLAVPSRIL